MQKLDPSQGSASVIHAAKKSFKASGCVRLGNILYSYESRMLLSGDCVLEIDNEVDISLTFCDQGTDEIRYTDGQLYLRRCI
jgi:hypothetical protein